MRSGSNVANKHDAPDDWDAEVTVAVVQLLELTDVHSKNETKHLNAAHGQNVPIF